MPVQISNCRAPWCTNISAPVIINHGGWETHDGSPVFVDGVRCPLPSTGGKTKVIFTPGQPPPPMGSQPPGCPDVGQPVLADPFAGRVVKPTAGAPACGTTVYNSNPYSPAESLNAAITVSATTVRSNGTVIQNGDIIEIGSERMLVTAPPTPVSSAFNVTRKAMAAGDATLTTSANHGLAVGETVIVNISDPRFDGTFTVTAVPSNTTFRYRAGSAVTNRVLTGGTVTLTTSSAHGLVTGNSVVVSINDPRFDGTFPITAVSTSTSLSYAAPSIATTSWSVAGNVATLTATTPPHGLAVGDAVIVTYTGGQAFLSGTYTLTAVTANTFSYALTYANGSGGQNGTAQLATAASAPATGLATLATMAAITTSGTVVVPDGLSVTVQRAFLGTTAAAPSANAAILLVTGTPTGVAASPAPCVVSSGTVTLWPGTYYGGIDIGSSGAACTPSSTGNAQVTLAPGTYIMAGGGLRVCGSSALLAPNVLIYNTNNAAQPSGNGAIGQVLLNTTGSVALGPQTGGQYQGLTIFQNPALALSDSQCDNRSSNEWDIALLDMASTGANGKLGSISGTIYAAHPHSLFGDSVSGTANLAVYTGCIRIEGANSTFNFESGGLFGTGSALAE